MSDAPESKLGGLGRWLLRDLPYAAMLVLAVGGIVLTSFRGPTTYFYWMALAPIYALIVIASGWRQLETGAERMRLVVTRPCIGPGRDVLMFLPRSVAGNLNATSLTLLIRWRWAPSLPACMPRCEISASSSLRSVPAVAWVKDQPCCCWSALLLILVARSVMWRRESRLEPT
jgi:hypothetical protein